jgi:hypothetical protein
MKKYPAVGHMWKSLFCCFILTLFWKLLHCRRSLIVGIHKLADFSYCIAEKICRDSDFTVDSTTTDKQCNVLPNAGSYCVARCKQGRVFVQQPQALWYVCYSGVWQPAPETVPDCTGKICISLVAIPTVFFVLICHSGDKRFSEFVPYFRLQQHR